MVLGIDIGGSGIEGAPVDLEKGVLVEDRWDPDAAACQARSVAEVVAEERARTGSFSESMELEQVG